MLFKHKNKDAPTRRRVSDHAPSTSDVSPAQKDFVFRRNQTLSSYRRGDDETSVRKSTHELNELRRKLFAICSVFVAITIVLLVILSQFTGRVAVVIEDVSTSIGDQYADSINAYYDANPLERFSFFLDKDKLLSHVQQKSLEINALVKVDSRGILTSTTTYTFTARRPIAKWAVGTGSYYVDSTGKAYLTNYFADPNISVIDENHLTIQPGTTTIASNRFLEFVGRVVSDIHLQGLEINTVTIPVGMSRELDITLKNASYPFKLSIDRSPSEQAEDIKRSIAYVNDKKIKPRYVDLRVKGRAYYKK